MVEHRSSTKLTIHGKVNGISDLKTPLFYSAPMDCELRRRMLCIGYFNNIAAGGLDGAPVADLAT
jgi:hypothetical protein